MTYDIDPHITGDTWDGIPSVTLGIAGSGVDLTGASIEMFVKSFYNLASPVVFSPTTANSGISILEPTTDGKFSILPTIVNIPVGKYQWGVTTTFASGRVKTYLMGIWNIIAKTPNNSNW